MRWQISWWIAFFFFQFSLGNHFLFGINLKKCFWGPMPFFSLMTLIFFQFDKFLNWIFVSPKKRKILFKWKNGYLTLWMFLVVKLAFSISGSNAHFSMCKVDYFFERIWNINWRLFLTKKKNHSLFKKWVFDPKNTFWGFSQIKNGS